MSPNTGVIGTYWYIGILVYWYIPIYQYTNVPIYQYTNIPIYLYKTSEFCLENTSRTSYLKNRWCPANCSMEIQIHSTLAAWTWWCCNAGEDSPQLNLMLHIIPNTTAHVITLLLMQIGSLMYVMMLRYQIACSQVVSTASLVSEHISSVVIFFFEHFYFITVKWPKKY